MSTTKKQFISYIGESVTFHSAGYILGTKYLFFKKALPQGGAALNDSANTTPCGEGLISIKASLIENTMIEEMLDSLEDKFDANLAAMYERKLG